MPRKEKINNFKSKTGIIDNPLAEKYLIRVNWDEDEAIKLYIKENKKNPKSNKNKTQANKNNQNVQIKIEYKISETLYSNEEVYTEEGKTAYIDMIKFLEGYFNISQNFKEFLSLLKKKAGLLIIFKKDKLYEVRNNMVRAFNNVLSKDILKSAVIFPVMTETETGNEFVKQLSPKEYPVYLFCKYKNSQIMTINAKVEKKFRMDNVINNLLDCYPENDVKQSIYQSINNTIINFKRKEQENDDEDDFSGDENEVDTMINKLKNDVRLSNTLFLANSQNNDNFFKPSIIDNKEENIDNNKPNNRFQNLFDKEDTSILIKELKISEQKPLIEESNKQIQTDNTKKDEIEEELRTIIIPREPEENDPNSCLITFRYPYDEKYINRRFNKNDKIEVLYDYVESLGKEIYSKTIYHSFELIYGFPPINFENKKDKTLDDEGLFPSSTINIVEK